MKFVERYTNYGPKGSQWRHFIPPMTSGFMKLSSKLIIYLIGDGLLYFPAFRDPTAVITRRRKKKPAASQRLLCPLAGHIASKPNNNNQSLPIKKSLSVLPPLEAKRQRYEAVLSEASYTSWAYNKTTPGIGFYKVLAGLPVSQWRVPTTFVAHAGAFVLLSPTPTGLNGQVFANASAVLQQLPRIARLLCRQDILCPYVAVLKRQQTPEFFRNTIDILSTKSHVTLQLQTMTNACQSSCLQSFVAPKGMIARKGTGITGSFNI